MTTRASDVIDILSAARVTNTPGGALSDCSMVLDASAYDRRVSQSLLNPRGCATTCLEHLEANGEVTLVFGREYADLTNRELQRCRFHMYIPSNPKFGSSNLAAAIQMFTHGAHIAWPAVQDKPTKMEKLESASILSTESVVADELELYCTRLGGTLIDIGFLGLERPCYLMSRLQRLYGRSVISKPEMDTLRGILIEAQKMARGLFCKRSDN